MAAATNSAQPDAARPSSDRSAAGTGHNQRPLADLTKDQELGAYHDMLLIRRFEEKAGQMYGMGLIGGFCHLYIGQEAVVIGMQMASKDGDQVITGYRPHDEISGEEYGHTAPEHPSGYRWAIDPLDGTVLADGEEGELVFTSLTKQALPIIRYEDVDEAARLHERVRAVATEVVDRLDRFGVQPALRECCERAPHGVTIDAIGFGDLHLARQFFTGGKAAASDARPNNPPPNNSRRLKPMRSPSAPIGNTIPAITRE